MRQNSSGQHSQQRLQSAASPSSKTMSRSPAHAKEQSKSYQYKEEDEVYENELDLTIVQEDTQPSPDTSHHLKQSSSHYERSRKSLGVTGLEAAVGQLDLGAISPTSDSVKDATIKDIKNASLYDLIKLQMVTQQRMKRSSEMTSRLITPVRGGKAKQQPAAAKQKQSSEMVRSLRSSAHGRLSREQHSLSHKNSQKQLTTVKTSTAGIFDRQRNSAQVVSRNSAVASRQIVVSSQGNLAGHRSSRLKPSTSKSLLKNPEDVLSEHNSISHQLNASQKSIKIVDVTKKQTRVSRRQQRPSTSTSRTSGQITQIKQVNASKKLGGLENSVGGKIPVSQSKIALSPHSRNVSGRQSQQTTIRHKTSSIKTELLDTSNSKRVYASFKNKKTQSGRTITTSTKKKEPSKATTVMDQQQRVAARLAQPKAKAVYSTTTTASRNSEKKAVSQTAGGGGTTAMTKSMMLTQGKQAPKQSQIFAVTGVRHNQELKQPKKTITIAVKRRYDRAVAKESINSSTGLSYLNSDMQSQTSSTKHRGQAVIPVKKSQQRNYQQQRRGDLLTTPSEIHTPSNIRTRMQALNFGQNPSSDIENTAVTTTQNDQDYQCVTERTDEQYSPTNKVITPGRVSRAERSRSSTERIKSSFKKQRSKEGTQADNSIEDGKRVSLGYGTEWTSSLQQKIQSMLKDQQQISPICMSDRTKREDSPPLHDSSAVQFDSPMRRRKTDAALTEADLRTPSPVKLLADDSDYVLTLKKQESKIEMFEEATLAKLEGLCTDRDDLPRSIVPQPTQYQPSPIKQKLPINRHQFFSRNEIKQILASLNISFIQDIVRIKKPQRPSQLIGQLFCMMIWVCRESQTSTLGKETQQPKVPFQNLEDEFESWENVQAFLNQNIVGLYQEIQTILQKFPVRKPFVDTYFRKMQHKIDVEARTLSRVSSTSLEKALSLVQAALDWHCKQMSSFKVSHATSLVKSQSVSRLNDSGPIQTTSVKRDPSQSIKRLPSASIQLAKLTLKQSGSMKVASTDQQQHQQQSKEMLREGGSSRVSLHEQPRKPRQQIATANLLAEQSKRHLKSKYQKYKPLSDSVGPPLNTISNYESATQQSDFSSTPKVSTHSFRKPKLSRVQLDQSRLTQSRQDLGGQTQELQMAVKSSSSLLQLRNPSSSSLNRGQREDLERQLHSETPAADIGLQSASPTSIEVNLNKPVLQSTVSSRNKKVLSSTVQASKTIDVVTHFGSQASRSPSTQRPHVTSNNFATRPISFARSSSLNRFRDIDNDDVVSEGNLEVANEDSDDEPINLVLQNGVASPNQFTTAPPISRNLQPLREEKEAFNTFDTVIPVVKQEMTLVTEEDSRQSRPGSLLQSQEFAMQPSSSEVSMGHHAGYQAQLPRQKSESVHVPKIEPVVEDQVYDDYGFEQNMGPIRVYQAKEKKDKKSAASFWAAGIDEPDSDDSFNIEPTNIGEYYEKQNRLHDELLSRKAQLNIMTAAKTPDETRQMIQELREKHLRGFENLPASPTSFIPQVQTLTPQSVKDESQIVNDDNGDIKTAEDPDSDFERLDEHDQQHEEISSYSHASAAPPGETFSYQQWQQKKFDDIVKQLDQNLPRRQ